MMKKYIFLILFVFLATYFTVAQSRMVHGVVHTFDSIPLIGAEIIIKSTGKSYFTDLYGNFTIECNPKDKLKILAEGFDNRKIHINEKIKFVAINLKLKSGETERKYNIGYGNTGEANRSGAVASLNYQDTDFNRYLNAFEIIRSNFSGVQVVGNEIIVRGNKTLSSSSAALIVIDGVISDEIVLGSLSPVEIKNIDVIKDSSSAVYGSRGTNGVVLVETFKGGEI